ncbi:MAG: tRNA (adenosine(37)-N6)-threonylcarbamoyltransferase complex dimerization subunit type 1 TsaB [Candidatus Babeliales bacterium]
MPKDQFFLALQHTYSHVDVALFQQATCIKTSSIDKQSASKFLVGTIEQILCDTNVSLDALRFIAVNKGPGPLTTMNVVISTANALGYALSRPLIGVNGLKTLVQEYTKESSPPTIGLLEAFNKCVYFYIQTASDKHIGCASIEQTLDTIQTLFLPETTLHFVGNGALKHETLIRSCLSSQVNILPESSTCSIQMIGRIAFHNWEASIDIDEAVTPLYLKQPVTPPTSTPSTESFSM